MARYIKYHGSSRTLVEFKSFKSSECDIKRVLSLCTDVPTPSGKIGRGDVSPLPIFPEGVGTSVHRLEGSLSTELHGAGEGGYPTKFFMGSLRLEF